MLRLRKNSYLLTLLTLIVCNVSAQTSPMMTQIRGVRLWPSPGALRIVFDVSRPTEAKVFSLKAPNRLVVDFAHTMAVTSLEKTEHKGLLKNIRAARHQDGRLRVVLDLKQGVSVNQFVLPPNAEYGYRIVLDLNVAKPETTARHPQTAHQPFIVAVDAGHGGEDPGARGRLGTQEKEVTFSIASILAYLINQTPDMKAILIREGDYYVGLRQRIEKARKQHANLFISIHADSYSKSTARGASVFVLSEHGASSESARFLANKENKSDEIGGVNLSHTDNALTRVLLDLSQTVTLKNSVTLASVVLDHLRPFCVLHKKKVQHAGFLVLKSPDIPSVLVETGFISHIPTERKLQQFSYRQKMAQALLDSIIAYRKMVVHL